MIGTPLGVRCLENFFTDSVLRFFIGVPERPPFSFECGDFKVGRREEEVFETIIPSTSEFIITAF
jgi:hypothetical protein